MLLNIDGPVIKNSAEFYDPKTDKWELIADMTFGRRNASKCYVKKKTVSNY